VGTTLVLLGSGVFPLADLHSDKLEQTTLGTPGVRVVPPATNQLGTRPTVVFAGMSDLSELSRLTMPGSSGHLRFVAMGPTSMDAPARWPVSRVMRVGTMRICSRLGMEEAIRKNEVR
jgi:hypothetical protein